MSQNPNQPREDDAVLGGQAPPPVFGVVLGGIEGVKKGLASPLIDARVAAIRTALNYGDAGLDLVIQALEDDSRQVQHSAYQLLKESSEYRVIQALRNYKFWEGFDRLYGLPSCHATTFANRKVEEFDPKIGITDPVGTACALRVNKWKTNDIDYIDELTYHLAKQLVNLTRTWDEWYKKKIEDNIIYRLAKLLQDPQIGQKLWYWGLGIAIAPVFSLTPSLPLTNS